MKYQKPNPQTLKSQLTPLQYKVTQEKATEAPFQNAYWDNKAPGIYIDVVTGEPLFSSLDKFDSRTGWPSFTKPLDEEKLRFEKDQSLGSSRIEVLSKTGATHLGHVFDDGPLPTGKRYCMNSAALKFIPLEDLEKHGLSDLKKLFEKS